MHYTIPFTNLNELRKRLQHEAWFYFWRIDIPIILIITILFNIFYAEVPLIFDLLVVLFFTFISLIKIMLYPKSLSIRYQKNYAITLDAEVVSDNIPWKKEINLDHACIYINRFGVIMLYDRSSNFLVRKFQLKEIKIFPEVENFDNLRRKIEDTILK